MRHIYHKKIPNSVRAATLIAILFHATGLAGILWGDTLLFARLTSLNMLVMLALVIWTHVHRDWSFYLFIFICFASGIAAEVIGVHTGILFGDYKYGKVLSPQMLDVPLLIGINWFLVLYCCGIGTHTLYAGIMARLVPHKPSRYIRWKKVSIIVDGALLAVFFDWIMEPVAVKLGFWEWLGNGSIPMLNYISWFAISFILLAVFAAFPIRKQNQFAIHLLLIQVMFFLLLRTFLPS